MPVIASALESVRELSDSDVFKIYVNTNPKGLSVHILALLADPESLSSMSAEGQRLTQRMSFARAGAMFWGRWRAHGQHLTTRFKKLS